MVGNVQTIEDDKAANPQPLVYIYDGADRLTSFMQQNPGESPVPGTLQLQWNNWKSQQQ